MPRLSERTQIIILQGVAVVLLLVVVVQLWINFGPQPSSITPSGSVITLEPQVIDSLTALPDATPLAGQAGEQLGSIETMIAGCDAYSPERRNQMEQHILWLKNPSEIPRDVAIALGGNPTGRLVFGMATFTSTQWRIDERPMDSCLVPIGRLLNDMLVAFGEPPLTIYDEATD